MRNPLPGEPPNVCAGGFGRLYDLVIERPWISQQVTRLVWGTDVRPMYESIDGLALVPAHSTILDVPCGGGVALRGLQPNQMIRYIGCDLSERMIERTKGRLKRTGIRNASVIQADMRSLPLQDGIADVCVCYNGLGMTTEPDRTVRELARCLRPGGTIYGSTMVSEGSRRQKAIMSLRSERGHVVPSGSAADLASWLRDGGLSEVSISADRGYVVFSGRRVDSA